MNLKTTLLIGFAKTIVFLFIVFVSFLSAKGLAQQTRYLDISISGGYSRSFSQYSESRRKSLGIELGLPLTPFFEVSLAHNLTQDSTLYNNAFKEAVKDRVDLPAGNITASRNIQDYSANGDLGIFIGNVRPSIFGGALRRKICEEDFLEDRGCQTQNLTWNAGFSLQIYITMALRLKASIRISPSVDVEREPKGYDQMTTFGLTWGI